MLSQLADVLVLVVSVVLFVPKLLVRTVHEVLYRYYPESVGLQPPLYVTYCKISLCLKTFLARVRVMRIIGDFPSYEKIFHPSTVS